MISFDSGRIKLQHCRTCGAIQAFGRDFCLTCLAPDPDWREASGRGRVFAATLQHRAPTSEWKERVPYTILLVDLNEGLRVMALGAQPFPAATLVALVAGGRFGLPLFDRSDA